MEFIGKFCELFTNEGVLNVLIMLMPLVIILIVMQVIGRAIDG